MLNQVTMIDLRNDTVTASSESRRTWRLSNVVALAPLLSRRVRAATPLDVTRTAIETAAEILAQSSRVRSDGG